MRHTSSTGELSREREETSAPDHEAAVAFRQRSAVISLVADRGCRLSIDHEPSRAADDRRAATGSVADAGDRAAIAGECVGTRDDGALAMNRTLMRVSDENERFHLRLRSIDSGKNRAPPHAAPDPTSRRQRRAPVVRTGGAGDGVLPGDLAVGHRHFDQLRVVVRVPDLNYLLRLQAHGVDIGALVLGQTSAHAGRASAVALEMCVAAFRTVDEFARTASGDPLPYPERERFFAFLCSTLMQDDSNESTTTLKERLIRLMSA